jgi:hypothetical protein
VQHLVHIVADEYDADAPISQLLDSTLAAALEANVSDSENFIDEENIWIAVRSDREPKAHIHSARITPNGRIDEIADPRELDNGVKTLADLVGGHPENRGVDGYVLPTREQRVEARADRDQRSDPTPNRDPAPIRPKDPVQTLEKGGLPGAIGADEAQGFSTRDFK